jgi:hypothetical protein
MAGVPIVDPQARSQQLGLLRNQFADNPGLMRKILLGLTDLPKRASEGEWVQPGGETLGYATNALGVAMPLAASTRAASGLGIFGGRNAATANHNMLKVAEDLEKAGVDSDDIWGFTGWGRGKDNKWRFEIDDSKAHLWSETTNKLRNTRGNIPLKPGGGGFSHPALYEAYPELKNTTLRADYSGNNGTFYGKRGENYDIALQSRPRPMMQSTLLHELQHAVQGIEGFGRGSNPGMHAPHPSIKRAGDARALIQLRLNSLLGKDGWKAYHEGKPIPHAEEVGKLMEAQRKIGALETNLNMRRGSHAQYRKVSGEVEARNVQHREEWDALKRSDVPPVYSEDVPRSKQKNWDVRPDMNLDLARKLLGLGPNQL